MRESKKYNYGIDLLKIISMMFIICVHVMGHGGVLASKLSNSQYMVCWIIDILVYCGVNCFAIISGFVGYKEDAVPKYSRYIELWIEVFFYSVGITALMLILGNNVTIEEIIKSFLPVTFNQYWYFSAYTGLFLIMPVLNCFIQKMDKENLVKVLIVAVLVYSLYGMFGTRLGNPLGLNSGYSVVWLAFLYVIGAYIRRYKIYEMVTKKKIIIIIGSSVFINISWKLFIGRMLGHGIDNLFISYVSPTMLAMSIGLVLLFSTLKIDDFFVKSVKFLSPTIFGIYLIHDHNLFRRYIMANNFTFVDKFNFITIPVIIFSIIIVIFIFGVLIERIRIRLFKILMVRNFSEKVESVLNLIINKISLIF